MTRDREALEELVSHAHSGADASGPVAAARTTRPYVFMQTTARWFGVDAFQVREVLERPEVSKVPAAPPYVAGLALVHGRLIPLIDLDRLLGAGEARSASQRLVVVTDGHREICLLATRVQGLIHVDVGDAGGKQPDRAPWVRAEIHHDRRDVSLVDVANLIETSTAAYARRS